MSWIYPTVSILAISEGVVLLLCGYGAFGKPANMDDGGIPDRSHYSQVCKLFGFGNLILGTIGLICSLVGILP